MTNPCELCLVISMCHKICEQYQDYVALCISGYGYDLIYKENLFQLPRTIKRYKNGRRTGTYTVFDESKGLWGNIYVYYDRTGTVLKVRIDYVKGEGRL